MDFWNPEFAPYAGYAWVYALAAGLYSIVMMVSSVELARHQYRFLWFLGVPTVAMCAILYRMRVSLTLTSLLVTVVGARTVALTGMVAQVIVRERRERMSVR